MLRSWIWMAALVTILVACVTLGLETRSFSETPPPPTPVPPGGRTFEGADMVFRWINVLITDNTKCKKDAEEALTDAFREFKAGNPTTKSPAWAAFNTAIHAATYNVALVAGNNAGQRRLDEHDFGGNAASVRTLTYSTKLEGGDENFDVFLVERDQDTYTMDSGDTMVLVGVFGLIYGKSQCGATEGKLEDDTCFKEAWIWFSGYYAYVRPKAGGYEYPSINLREFRKIYDKKNKALGSDGKLVTICCTLTGAVMTPPPKAGENPEQPIKPAQPVKPVEPPSDNAPGGTVPPPVDKDKSLRPLEPQPGKGGGSDGGVYLPPIAGPGAMIVGTVEDPSTNTASGPTNFIVGTVEPDGRKKFWHGLTDERGHFKIGLPLEVITGLLLFREFDPKGHPDGGATCTIGRPPHLDGTTPLTNVPTSQQPAILEGSPSYQRGANSVFNLHTRGTNPLNTRVLMDGKPDGVQTLGISDESVAARFGNDVPLGRHRMSVMSNGKNSNEFTAVLVTVMGEPLAPSTPGQVNTVRVHIDGLPPDQSASMAFQVGGAATLLDGGSTTTVPVKDGIAQIQIRGVHAGQALVRFTLLMTAPGFAPQN